MLSGFENFILDTNANILSRTTEFLKAIKRFNGLLFKSKLKLLNALTVYFLRAN